MRKIRLAVMISGRGSNMEAIIKECRKRTAVSEVVLVIADRKDTRGIEIAQRHGIPCEVIPFINRFQFCASASKAVTEHHADLVVLAGLMRILDSTFVNNHATLNIHPSLLPDFPGLHPHRQALAAGVSMSGCTVHWVIPEVDAGPMVAQMTVPVFSNDTEDSLAARILVKEHLLYPLAINIISATILAVWDVALNDR